jgi:hypothetical protein
LKYRLQKLLLPFTVIFFSVVAFRSGLGRNDTEHIYQIDFYIYLATFVLLDHCLEASKNLVHRWALLLLPLIFFIFPQSNWARWANMAPLTRTNLRILFRLPRINDDFWLTPEAKRVTEFVTSHTTPQDKIFVFTNESAYYYLARRDNPTRFYTAWFSAPNFFQKEILTDLTNDPPALVLYQSQTWPNKIDGFTNREKLTSLDNWLRERYPEEATVDSMLILTR